MTEKHLEYIRDNYLENGKTDIKGFYKQVKGSTHVSRRDAVDMADRLREGRIGEVEKKLEELIV